MKPFFSILNRGGERKVRKRRTKGVLALFMVLSMILPQTPAFSICLEISDSPMDTKVLSGPPNIMFVFDNSGSMDWEFMIQGASEGLYEGRYYPFDNPGDNNYTGSILSDEQRLEWKSQWAGYNKLGYSPHTSYTPWPSMTDADTSTPRSNPTVDGNTLDLTAEFVNVPEQTAYINQVIVDNGDAGFSYTGPWSDAGSYYWSDALDHYTATWTATLEPGEYVVHVYYTANNYRSTALPYTVVDDTGQTAFPINQRENGNTWVQLGTGTFDFSSGNATVFIDYTKTGSYDRACADQVRFSMPVTRDAVSIKNAHYYVIDDVDDDGELDEGEGIYLVTFVSGVRQYYLFQDSDGDDRIDPGELSSVAVDDLPDSVRAKKYSELGDFVGYVSDAEDLQNFANWYSFYRKREYVAKAAVSNSIVNLNRVQVGFYTINSGVRQTVMPINVETNAIIVDNKDSGYSETGGWSESGSPNEYADSSRYTSSSGNTATFRPNLPAAGDYNVYAWWNCYNNRDQKARYTVSYSGGSASFEMNQRLEAGNVCGDWVQLGSSPFTFDVGTTGTVTVARHSGSTGSSTNADAVKFEPVSGGVNVDQTDNLLAILYSIDSHDSTPLRTALQAVGRYYHQDDGSTGNLGTSPYWDEADGGGCQHAFAIVISDGYWNGGTPSGIGNQDGSKGSPYADSHSDTLADVAMYYYSNDLASGLSDVVPTTTCDQAAHQHMVTYTISFGVTGTLTPDMNDPCFLNPDTTRPTWPNPTSSDPAKIDDLWHAAVNGRGIFFSAEDPQQLVDSLTALMQDIESRTSSGASVSVNGEELNSGTILYQSTYETSGWTGDVTAYPVNPDTGEVLRTADQILWKASEKLQALGWSSRNVLTYKGSSLTTFTGTDAGKAFEWSNLTDDQKSDLGSDLVSGSDAETRAINLVDYLKGKEISGFRPRTRILGDIVHSAPYLFGNSIFVGANDGMLHVFNATTGLERFAYIPGHVFPNLPNLGEIDFQHKFYVDQTPYIRGNVDLEGYANPIDLLVGGLGKGGKGVFALDVTNADSVDYSTSASTLGGMVKWEYPNTLVESDGIDSDLDGTVDQGTDGIDNDGDSIIDEDDEKEMADMGYTFAAPAIVRSNSATASEKWVVIFGNGYQNITNKSVLYILNAADGSVIRKIAAGAGYGLSTASVVDVNNDFLADYVYAGDLAGNLWKFDITDSDPDNWGVAYGTDNTSDGVIDLDDGDTPKPLFSTGGQPISAKPDVMRHCTRHGYMVNFGTGKYLSASATCNDRGDTTQQSIYGIWDYGDDADDSEYLGVISDRSTGALDYPASPHNVSLLKQEVLTISGLSSIYGVTTQKIANWAVANDAQTNQFPNPSGTVTCCDSVDNDSDGSTDESDEAVAHAGWFLDLPETGERVIKDVFIRSYRSIALSFVPNSSPCSGGGDTFLNELNACDGGRLDYPAIDVNGDLMLTGSDKITVRDSDSDGEFDTLVTGEPGANDEEVPVSRVRYAGMLHPPVILQLPDTSDEAVAGGGEGEEGDDDEEDEDDREVKIFSTSAGNTQTVFESAEKRGMFYWLER